MNIKRALLPVIATWLVSLSVPASAAPIYQSADFSGGLNSVTATMKSRLTAVGFDAALFNCWSCANATPVSGHVIFDAAVPISPSGAVNVFSISAIPNVANAMIFEFNVDGISMHFGDAGIQGGPAFQYLNGVYNGFFFATDFNSPNGTLLRFNAQGSVFSLRRISDNAVLFSGFLDVGTGGLTNIRAFPPSAVPEPTSMFLVAVGLAGLAARRRSRK